MGNSSSLGLIVEGQYDEAILRRLVPRLLTDPTPALVIRACGGSRLRGRFPGFLQEFQWLNAGGPLEKAFVIADTDLQETEATERELAARVQGRTFHFPNGVQFCAVRREIEAWLLADEDAITSVARDRGVGRRPAAKVNAQPEEIVHPKEHLQATLSVCGLPYTAAVCGVIAAQLSLDRLRYRCPSFRRFEEKLHDC